VSEPVTVEPWRVGTRIPEHVYIGDRPLVTMPTAELAALVVRAVNGYDAALARIGEAIADEKRDAAALEACEKHLQIVSESREAALARAEALTEQSESWRLAQLRWQQWAGALLQKLRAQPDHGALGDVPARETIESRLTDALARVDELEGHMLSMADKNDSWRARAVTAERINTLAERSDNYQTALEAWNDEITQRQSAEQDAEEWKQSSRDWKSRAETAESRTCCNRCLRD
jgi:hypothetical protein